jgi:hypothetical protein
MSIAPQPEAATKYTVARWPRPVSSTVSFPIRLLLAIFVIFFFPAFTVQLAMDPITGRFVGSPVLQVITISSELFVFALILSSRNIRTLVLLCWPVWVLIAVAFVSTVWSRNPVATIHASNTFMTTALLGLTVAGALPGFQSVRFIIRTMVLGCLLSVLWALLFPEVGMHQLTDPYQTVHAGLWRGIFSHKQGLGYFSGLTTGLLLYYRTSIFPMPVLILSFACSVGCLIGTQSATGIVAAVIAPAFLYVSYLVTRFPVSLRKPMFLKFGLGIIAIGIAYKVGILNFVIVEILGKSTDLTGRADFWPIILQNFESSGSSLLGGGFGANIAAEMSEWSVDNGYIDKFLEFGYISSTVVFGTFAGILWGGIRLILSTPAEHARTNIFPFAIWSVTLILNITESNFMLKCFSTVLMAIAIGLIFQQKQSIRSITPLQGRR